jgi:exonuclease VII large subunit
LIERLARSLELQRPEREFERRRATVAIAEDRLRHAARRMVKKRYEVVALGRLLTAAVHRRVSRASELLQLQQQTIRAVEVGAVLRRGFSYTQGPTGKILRSIVEVEAGDALTTHLADGSVRSVVRGSSSKRRRQAISDGAPINQLDLFESSR